MNARLSSENIQFCEVIDLIWSNPFRTFVNLSTTYQTHGNVGQHLEGTQVYIIRGVDGGAGGVVDKRFPRTCSRGEEQSYIKSRGTSMEEEVESLVPPSNGY